MPKIKFAIAQMNPTVGDFAANSGKIIEWIRSAEARGADMIVFPEMALCGYPVWDLALKKNFIKTSLQYLDRIVRATAKLKITVGLGYIDQGPVGTGRSVNAAVFFSGGRIFVKQAKRLLPNYDVFLEKIFFEPGTKSSAFQWKAGKVGPMICEDLWDDGYAQKPMQDLVQQGAKLVVNISASPYYQGVSEVRDKLVKNHSAKHRVPLLYVNQVGSQDDLIFDGRSFFADASGRILFRAPAFQEGLFFFDWEPERKAPHDAAPAAYSGKPEEIYRALVLGIRDYCRKNGFKKAVIGMSGGIDSALVTALAVDALGKDAVLGLTMPGPHSSEGSWKDSSDMAKRLGIELRKVPITATFDSLLRSQKRGEKAQGKVTLAMENLQSRLRGVEQMYVSNDEDRISLTTGNKSELAMGYCTLYGDMAGGLGVLGDVYKTDVYKLAEYRNSVSKVIPQAIIDKAPSAELRPNQTDQDSLPPYDLLDQVLYLYIEKNLSDAEILKSMKGKKISAERILEVLRKVDRSEYKRRQSPPILRVTEKAWFGRRMPITNRFRS